MTAALETLLIGGQQHPPAELERIPYDTDSTVYLARWLERKMYDGYMIVESRGNPGVFAVCQRPLVDWYNVWRVRIINLGEGDCGSD